MTDELRLEIQRARDERQEGTLQDFVNLLLVVATTVAVDGTTRAGTNRTWVVEKGGRQPKAVWGSITRANVDVLMIRIPGNELMILAVFLPDATDVWGESAPTVAMPPLDFRLLRGMLPSFRFEPGAVTLPNPVDGLYVYVYPFAHRGGAWLGGRKLTVNNAATDEQTLTIVSINTLDNTVALTEGATTYPLARLATANEIFEEAATIETPEHYSRRAVVRLRDGQTTLTDADIVDIREWADGGLQEPLTVAGPTTLTLATGEITVTQTYHLVDTEGAASSDDLDAINGLDEGQWLILRAANTARTVVIKNGADIVTNTGSDYSLDDDSKWALFIGKGGGVALMYPIGGSSGLSSPLSADLDFGANDALNINYIEVNELSGGSIPGTPASGKVRLYAKSDGKAYAKDDAGTEYDLATGSGSADHDWFDKAAALLEPDALETIETGTFTKAIGSGVTKYCIASWNTRLGSNGRFEVRDPARPHALRNVTMTGLASGSTAVFLDPSLPTYSDARDTYYDRLKLLDELDTKYIAFTAPNQVQVFLPGPYGNILTGLTVFDLTWIAAQYAGTYGFNLANEIGDTGSTEYIRLSNKLLVPLSKKIISNFLSGAEKSAGVGAGGLTFVVLPSTWSAVADPTTYDFRDDFMGTSLDTATKWTRAQSTAGNIEINTFWQWLKTTGNGSWGANGAFSQASVSRANGKVFMADVYTGAGTGNLIVGWHDGAGHSFADFAHGLDFTNSGANDLQVFENSTSRGVVGTWENNRLYRVRITLNGASAATYEIQGGAFGKIGSASWSDITPGTSSSATTPLHAGVAINTNVSDWFVGDVKVY
jgi:hypothetical protein